MSSINMNADSWSYLSALRHSHISKFFKSFCFHIRNFRICVLLSTNLLIDIFSSSVTMVILTSDLIFIRIFSKRRGIIIKLGNLFYFSLSINVYIVKWCIYLYRVTHICRFLVLLYVNCCERLRYGEGRARDAICHPFC